MPIACLLLYVVTSMIGMLTIPWTMTAELFPTEIRGLAHSIAYSVANLIMFASVQSYRDLDHLLGGSAGVQWFFAVVSIGGKIRLQFVNMSFSSQLKLLKNSITLGIRNSLSHYC